MQEELIEARSTVASLSQETQVYSTQVEHAAAILAALLATEEPSTATTASLESSSATDASMTPGTKSHTHEMVAMATEIAGRLMRQLGSDASLTAHLDFLCAPPKLAHVALETANQDHLQALAVQETAMAAAGTALQGVVTHLKEARALLLTRLAGGDAGTDTEGSVPSVAVTAARVADKGALVVVERELEDSKAKVYFNLVWDVKKCVAVGVGG
jgi:hypothetical protein